MNDESKKKWIARNWYWIVGVAGAIWLVFLQGSEAISNAEKLPNAVTSAKDKLLSWHYEDDQWTGVWSAKAEGYVGGPALSDTDVHVEIVVSQGQVDGTIATKKICSIFPMWDFVLLQGQISGNAFDGVAWDIVQGERKNFALVHFQREGSFMKVTPKEGNVDWFPAEALIAQHPGAEPMTVGPVDQSYCYEEKMAFARESFGGTNTSLEAR